MFDETTDNGSGFAFTQVNLEDTYTVHFHTFSLLFVGLSVSITCY